MPGDAAGNGTVTVAHVPCKVLEIRSGIMKRKQPNEGWKESVRMVLLARTKTHRRRGRNYCEQSLSDIRSTSAPTRIDSENG